ncbi:ABC transporter permease [Fonticella tunisiensis]|uniref:Putative ABC transport system permease protein n=1 Tax=Fonticella tunisiensis TaxID=1096341 RepID=A0A4R7KRH8_9CLOT|nr:ABC transporter permease [Fonticella tunisiensis]TDT61346.1 putative ABC transport system permease protein [Fonticella tunisiensis]
MSGLIGVVLEQGFIFGIMALGVYITYRTLDFPDLSVDGTFALGAAVTAASLVKGINPITACTLSLLAGILAGAVTGFLHVKLGITNLLSGILVMIGLYSINLRIMGKANLPFFNKETIFTGSSPKIVIVLVIAIGVKLILDLFLKTKIGFVLRATGDNPGIVVSLGIDIGLIKILGLALSNGLVSLSGSIMAQYQRFSDVGMGSGIIVMGLASIIFGESVLKRFSLISPSTMVLAGAIMYKASTSIALELGFPPTDLKLITSIIVVIALGLSNKRIGTTLKRVISRGGDSNAANAKSA